MRLRPLNPLRNVKVPKGERFDRVLVVSAGTSDVPDRLLEVVLVERALRKRGHQRHYGEEREGRRKEEDEGRTPPSKALFPI
jgi:hypothetical protein